MHALDARTTTVEKDLATLKTDVAVIRSNYATKQDLQKEMHALTWKLFGFCSVLVGIVFTIAKNMH